MALTTGVVSQHTARRFFRQSCQEKLPRTRPLHMEESTLEPGFLKGRFYGQVCFMKKKTRWKTEIFELHGFFLWNISPFYFPLAIWLLPRDNHYGNWPRSGEIDLMETKGMDTLLAYFFHLFFFNRKGVHYMHISSKFQDTLWIFRKRLDQWMGRRSRDPLHWFHTSLGTRCRTQLFPKNSRWKVSHKKNY